MRLKTGISVLSLNVLLVLLIGQEVRVTLLPDAGKILGVACRNRGMLAS